MDAISRVGMFLRWPVGCPASEGEDITYEEAKEHCTKWNNKSNPISLQKTSRATCLGIGLIAVGILSGLFSNDNPIRKWVALIFGGVGVILSIIGHALSFDMSNTTGVGENKKDLGKVNENDEPEPTEGKIFAISDLVNDEIIHSKLMMALTFLNSGRQVSVREKGLEELSQIYKKYPIHRITVISTFLNLIKNPEEKPKLRVAAIEILTGNLDDKGIGILENENPPDKSQPIEKYRLWRTETASALIEVLKRPDEKNLIKKTVVNALERCSEPTLCNFSTELACIVKNKNDTEEANELCAHIIPTFRGIYEQIRSSELFDRALYGAIIRAVKDTDEGVRLVGAREIRKIFSRAVKKNVDPEFLGLYIDNILFLAKEEKSEEIRNIVLLDLPKVYRVCKDNKKIEHRAKDVERLILEIVKGDYQNTTESRKLLVNNVLHLYRREQGDKIPVKDLLLNSLAETIINTVRDECQRSASFCTDLTVRLGTIYLQTKDASLLNKIILVISDSKESSGFRKNMLSVIESIYLSTKEKTIIQIAEEQILPDGVSEDEFTSYAQSVLDLLKESA